MRISRASLFLSALMFAAVPIGTTAPAQAQTAGIDEWGLTPQDWLRMDGPSLSTAAGIPGSLPRVRAAAAHGDTKAAALLGSALVVGAGVAKDYVEAERWLGRSAHSGLPFAYFSLGAMYNNGNIAPLNKAEGQRWMVKAADAGFSIVKFYAGLRLVEDASGDGTNQPDPIAARRYIEDAVADGVPEAAKLTEVWTFNEAFIDVARGMPLWKDGRGLMRGHGDQMDAWHPCRTDILSDRGGRWTIDWTQTQTNGGARGTVEFVGVIWVHEVNQSSKVFGLFENEAASRNLGRSRANFQKIKEMGNLLHLRCTTLNS